MNSLGILLKQEVLSIENTRQDYTTKNGTRSEIHSKVMLRFTWIDTDSNEREECLFGANGQNDWERGVPSAMTLGERYFLLKFFHIATDEDDIDNPERKAAEEAERSVKQTALDLVKNSNLPEDLKKQWNAYIETNTVQTVQGQLAALQKQVEAASTQP
jgi:hypothetical protein